MHVHPPVGTTRLDDLGPLADQPFRAGRLLRVGIETPRPPAQEDDLADLEHAGDRQHHDVPGGRHGREDDEQDREEEDHPAIVQRTFGPLIIPLG